MRTSLLLFILVAGVLFSPSHLRRVSRTEMKLNVHVVHPPEAQGPLREGLSRLREGKVQQARTHFRAAVSADPELTAAWVGLGVAESMLNHDRESSAAFARGNNTVEAMTRRVRKCHSALLLHTRDAFKEMSEAIATHGHSSSWGLWFKRHANGLSLAAAKCDLPWDYLTPLLASIVTGVFSAQGLHLLFIETFMQITRHSLLHAREIGEVSIELALLVARYASHTDYILESSPQEEAIVIQFMETSSISFFKATMFAAYRPRQEWPKKVTTALHRGCTTWPQARLFWQQVVLNVDEELRIMKTKLDTVEATQRCDTNENTTCTVAQMYMSAPYPTWDDPVRRAQTISLIPSSGVRHQAPRILIAGAGTGKVAIRHALGYSGAASVLAIDISARSLAFGMRAARQMGVHNVEWRVQSLLALSPKQDGLFDIIHCTGVLHHLARPSEGFKALERMLRPGGTLHVAVYSESARRSVARARGVVLQHGLERNLQDLKRFRGRAKRDPKLAELLTSPDFYTRQELVDLVFHAQEHQYTYKQLNSELQSVNLHVISNCQAWAHPDIMRKFHARFPGQYDMLDLSKWHSYEADAGWPALQMYIVDTRKPNPRDTNDRYIMRCKNTQGRGEGSEVAFAGTLCSPEAIHNHVHNNMK